jgi:hypothetical protein
MQIMSQEMMLARSFLRTSKSTRTTGLDLSKIHELRREVNNLNQEKLKLLAEINAIPKLAAAVVKLFSIEGKIIALRN